MGNKEKCKRYQEKLAARLANLLGEPVSLRQARALAKLKGGPDQVKKVWHQAKTEGNIGGAALDKMVSTVSTVEAGVNGAGVNDCSVNGVNDVEPGEPLAPSRRRTTMTLPARGKPLGKPYLFRDSDKQGAFDNPFKTPESRLVQTPDGSMLDPSEF